MIVKNLIEMLQGGEAVYINGIGLFQKQFHPAKVTKTEVLPPHYSVTLDNDADGSGFDFILYVSNHGGMKIVDADESVRNWQEELAEKLQSEKHVKVPDFGTFTLKKGVISFESDFIPALNSEFEGMSPISLKEEVVDIQTEKVEPVVVQNPIPENHVEPEPETEVIPVPAVSPEVIAVPEPELVIAPDPIVEPEPVVEPESVIEPEPEIEPEPKPVVESEPIIEPEPEPVIEPEPVVEPGPEPVIEPEPEPVVEPGETENDDAGETAGSNKKSHRWIWILLIIIVLLAAIGIVGYLYRDTVCECYHKIFDKQTSEVVTEPTPEAEPAPLEEPAAVTDSVAEAEEPLAEPEDVVQPAPAFDINNVQHLTFEQGKYYVVHGSFGVDADCVKHIKQQHFERYSPTIVSVAGDWHLRVCLGVFNSEAEAENFAANIKNAWVLGK